MLSPVRLAALLVDVARDVFVRETREVEVWLGFELRGAPGPEARRRRAGGSWISGADAAATIACNLDALPISGRGRRSELARRIQPAATNGISGCAPPPGRAACR